MRSITAALIVCLLVVRCIADESRNDKLGTSDLQEWMKSCQIVGMTLAAREHMRERGDVLGSDDFTAAGQACDHLKATIAMSDPAKIEKAKQDLRPIFARLGMPPSTPQEQFAALEKESAALSGTVLFYKLPDLAKRAFDAGEISKAETYAKRLLEIAPQYPNDWNYGNAIFYGNFVLGRIAVKRGDFAGAEKYLLAAGATPGSPQLKSFGPNMTLAKELVEKGQSDAVLRFLALCKKFWEMDHGKLNQWSAAIRAGKTPDFGSNLLY